MEKGNVTVDRVFLRRTAAISRQRRRRQRGRRILTAAAALVVFCTVYALILPAITMERPAECGLEEHTHTEACY